jgi:hypothetical protein
MRKTPVKIITMLSLVLALSLAIVSYNGAFVKETYVHETPSMAAQGMGQDVVDLFIVLPLLLFSLLFVRRNKKVAYFIFGGTLFYLLYSFVIYSLGVHFNNLFLWYCLTLGLSLYTFIIMITELNRMEVEIWFNQKLPVRVIAGYLIIVAILFYLIWFKDIVPAVLSSTIPKSISDYNLLVNPVHVIDISFVLPGLIITAIFLIRKLRLGFIFAPIVLVFILLMALALIGMLVMLKVKGIAEETSIVGIFITLAIINTVFLWIFFKNFKAD